jgi:hypothetical protein
MIDGGFEGVPCPIVRKPALRPPHAWLPPPDRRQDPATRSFTLPPEHALLLLDADLLGAFQLSVGSGRDEAKISDAFRTGAGVGWHEHDTGVYEGCELHGS